MPNKPVASEAQRQLVGRRRSGGNKSRLIPKRIFREMGLGKRRGDSVKVIAGYAITWWDMFSDGLPVIVEARIISTNSADPVSSGEKEGD